MEINIDFQKVIAQANQIEELAEALKQESNGNLETALMSVSSVWTGNAADAFMKKGVQLQQNLEKTANELRQTADVVRDIATALYHAEQQAERLAQQREY